MKIIVADPAGNITVLVLDPVESPQERAALAGAILAEKSLRAEQVGFVQPPVSESTAGGLWRLEMAGGEFCGNAARSFGLYIAGQRGMGRAKLFVSVSGEAGPVAVEADVEKGWAQAEMPKPLAIETLDYGGRSLPALIFEGISHIIAEDLEPAGETFNEIRSLAERKLKPFPALGIMFYDTASRFMRPAVYVGAAASLIFESSCGSGSAAMGLWLSREMRDGQAQYDIAQPGGLIQTRVIKEAGGIRNLVIGGEVKLAEPQEFFL